MNKLAHIHKVRHHGRFVAKTETANNTEFIDTWQVKDPLADKYFSTSPYAFCGNNPVNLVDPDGKRQWPINEKYNGHARKHENNFGAPRKNNRTHQGLDINLGSGNNDLGAPVFATHSGKVTRYRKFNEDTDGGGNRIQITSENGEVATSYMHLNTMANLKEGDFVSEGDFLGTIGGSGNGAINEHPAHLHYELKIDGVNVNPVIDANNLIDPQTLIAPEIHENLQPIFVYGQRKQIKIDLPKLLTY